MSFKRKINVFIENITGPHHITMYIVYIFIIIIVSIIGYINYIVVKKYGTKYTSTIQFPFVFLASLFVFFATGKIGIDTSRNREKYDKSLGVDLSIFTQRLVVDRWEKEVSENKKLTDIYKSIFSKPSNSHNKNGFYTRCQWEKNFPDIPYVPYEGNEDQWHFATKYIQEQYNIYRMFHLGESFRLGNEDDLQKSQEGPFAGWLSCFRMFYTNSTIRNVWEQYKYRHGNPKYSAWVKYYVIDVIKKPDFFKNHKMKWDKNVNDLINKYKKIYYDRNKSINLKTNKY